MPTRRAPGAVSGLFGRCETSCAVIPRVPASRPLPTLRVLYSARSGHEAVKNPKVGLGKNRMMLAAQPPEHVFRRHLLIALEAVHRIPNRIDPIAVPNVERVLHGEVCSRE
jgi:hypothetical protein